MRMPWSSRTTNVNLWSKKSIPGSKTGSFYWVLLLNRWMSVLPFWVQDQWLEPEKVYARVDWYRHGQSGHTCSLALDIQPDKCFNSFFNLSHFTSNKGLRTVGWYKQHMEIPLCYVKICRYRVSHAPHQQANLKQIRAKPTHMFPRPVKKTLNHHKGFSNNAIHIITIQLK